LWLIRGQVNLALGNAQNAKSDFEQALKVDSAVANEYINKKSNVVINPFPIGNRLCGLFPDVKISIQG